MGITSKFQIALIDGSSIDPESLMAGLASGKKYYGYGIDSYGDIVITQITTVEKSGDKREMSRLLLIGADLLEKITDDQQIVKMVKKAPSPTPLSGLGKGDALYTLIRYKDNEGNELLIRHKNIDETPTYRLADFYNVWHNVYPDKPGDIYLPIHIDGNKSNNNPGNIKRITQKEAGLKPTSAKTLEEQSKKKQPRALDWEKTEPVFYSPPNVLEMTERFKIAEKKRLEDLKSKPGMAAALEGGISVDKVKLMYIDDNEDEETRKVLKDYVFTITTETGNFAIEPGLFLKS